MNHRDTETQRFLLKFFLCVLCVFVVHFKAFANDNFIVFLVDAPHLDYSCNKSLLKTIAKHPSNGRKNGDVGHAWIYLQGFQNGCKVYLEGGHSGELGLCQPKYFEGVMDNYESGCANPIKYLWESQRDGFFQHGNGKHTPTFACKVDITSEQFENILRFIQSYNFSDYSLTENQCSSFITQVAQLAGLDLPSSMTINIQQTVTINGECIRLWRDPRYSLLTFASPDLLEYHLKLAVMEGRACYALPWYRKTHARPLGKCLADFWDECVLFPERLCRTLYFIF